MFLAQAVCQITLKETSARGLLTYSSDAHFVMNSYAVLSLLKVSTKCVSSPPRFHAKSIDTLQLIRPEFRSLHNRHAYILELVSQVADAMANAAADPFHTPALYSTLLKSLIAAKSEEIKNDPAYQSNHVNGFSQGNTSLDPSIFSGRPMSHGSGGHAVQDSKDAMYSNIFGAGSQTSNFGDPFSFA